jgi:hypothetical protein
MDGAYCRAVAPTVYRSLLDDPRFLAELERIDIPGGSEIESLLRLEGDFEWVLPPPPAPRVYLPERHATATAKGRIVLGLAGVLLMMAIGGTVAALVFADRVAVILTRP